MSDSTARRGLLYGVLIGSLSLAVACFRRVLRGSSQPVPPRPDPVAEPYQARLSALEERLAILDERLLALVANLEQANLAFRRVAGRVNELAAAVDRGDPPGE